MGRQQRKGSSAGNRKGHAGKALRSEGGRGGHREGVSPVFVREAGGWDVLGAHTAHLAERLHTRELAESWDPARYVRELWKHKHPRALSCGVLRTRWGERARKQVGMGSAGTVWFATEDERDDCHVIPANSIPYATIEGATWNEDLGRYEKDGSVTRGWRNSFYLLTKDGWLRPSRALSYLMGEDSFALCPRRFHV